MSVPTMIDEKELLLAEDFNNDDVSNDIESQNEKSSEAEHEQEATFQTTQVIALCCAAIVEPVACFCIFPFIAEMIQHTGGTSGSDVGFWAGAIESLFSVVQMSVMMGYGRMSDKFGRKPVLVFSLLGLSVTTMLFGLSRSLLQMIIFRCLSGLFAGSVVTARIMVSESCTTSTEARTFAWFMFSRNLGILLGPIIGGLFANVQLFDQVPALKDYPYFPATFAAGATCLLGTILIAVLSKETLTRTKAEKSGPAKDAMTTLQLLRSPGVSTALFSFGCTRFLSLANTAVLPVFLFTSIDKGGFGFSPQFISYFLAGWAACQALWTLVCFAPLKRRLGNARVMQLCSAGWPLLFASFAVLNEMLRHGHTTLFWTFLAVPLLLGGGIAMSFASAQLLVNDTCPSPQETALINAISQTLNSAIRAVTPAIFTTVFALGTKYQILDGHLCWIALAAVALPLSL
ncbi:major facilitator superfamily transporter like protein [Zymoseptoria brevis]|uniref:Major facilitator superfamily transporter like protein n=1 Tax=Zymoseptoria brevis TaxID=1047168 RepID=A0A0F4G9A4_9PEZI|nr:major facilitator superfamily transporter like protein [Zymoseptoria brevis]